MWINLFSKTQYDWPRILKEKTNAELNDFVRKALVDVEAKVATIDELKRRKIDPKRIEELSSNILKDLKSKKTELLQITLLDKIDKYSLFIQIAILPIFLYSAFHFIQNFNFLISFYFFQG